MKVRSVFREPWDQTSNIATYARRLDKQQAQLKKYGAPTSNKEKTYQYVEQMYRSNMFNEMEICKWECKSDTKKTWELARKYLENLFTEKQTFQDSMSAGKNVF